MASPVRPPIEAHRHGQTRWQLHATSLSETLGPAVPDLGRARPWRASLRAPRTRWRASILEDPLLAPGAVEQGELRVRTRTSVLTLVVVAPTPETQERALATVGGARLAASRRAP